MLDQINGWAVRDLAEHQIFTPAVCITYCIWRNSNLFKGRSDTRKFCTVLTSYWASLTEAFVIFLTREWKKLIFKNFPVSEPKYRRQVRWSRSQRACGLGPVRSWTAGTWYRKFESPSGHWAGCCSSDALGMYSGGTMLIFLGPSKQMARVTYHPTFHSYSLDTKIWSNNPQEKKLLTLIIFCFVYSL
jgi:hypothetical protein